METFEKLPRGRDEQALRKRLEACHKELEAMEQKDEDEDTPYLDSMAQELVQAWLLKHRNINIRMLVGCCLADILFIYVPNPPFTNIQLKRIFEFLLDRIRGLSQSSTTASYKRSLYILEKLALSTSSCLLINLSDDSGDPCTSEDLMVALVEAMFDIMVTGQSDQAEGWVLDLLVGLMDNLENITPRLLESLLVHLLSETAEEAPREHALAFRVVQESASHLQESISTLLSGLISGVAVSSSSSLRRSRRPRRQKAKKRQTTKDSDDRDSSSSDDDEEEDEGACLIGAANQDEAMDLKDKVHDLVLQLFKVDQSILLHALSQLMEQLDVDDLTVRKKAVDLFGRIFCEVESETFLVENERVWAAFLRRIMDVNTDIRVSLVRFAGFALNAAPLVRQVDETDDKMIDDDSDVGNALKSDDEDDDEGGSVGRTWFVRHFISPGFQTTYAKKITESVEDTSTQPSFLEIALNDKDIVVRREAVEVVVDFIGTSNVLQHFKACKTDDGLLRALASRLRDRKIDIANNALEGLARCFMGNLVERYWVPRGQSSLENPDDGGISSGSSSSDEDEIPEPKDPADDMTKHEKFAEETLGWIPDELVKQHFQQRSLEDDLLYRVTLCNMLNAMMTGEKSRDAKVSAYILGLIWTSLSDLGRKGFERIYCEQRSRLLQLLRGVVQTHFENRASKRARQSLSSSSSSSSGTSTNAVAMAKQTLARIANGFIPSSRCPSAANLAVELWDFKDKFIFRDLRIICDVSSTMDQVKVAVDDCFKRIGSKSETTRMLRIVFSRMGALTNLNQVVIEMVRSVIRTEASNCRDETVVSLCQLVKLLVQHFPALECQGAAAWMFHASFDKFCRDLKKTKKNESGLSNKLMKETFQVLGRTACTISSKRASSNSDEELLDMMEIMLLRSGDLVCSKASAKYWLSVMMSDMEQHKKRFIKVLRLILRSTKRSTGMKLASAFAVLKVILKHAPRHCSECDLGLSETMGAIFDRVKAPFPAGSSSSKKRNSSSSSAAMSVEGIVKVQGVKVIAFEVIRRTLALDSPEKSETRRFILLLRKIVADGGDPWQREKERREAVSDSGDVPTQSWPPSKQAHLANLRLAAACSLVEIEAKCIDASCKGYLQEDNDLILEREVQRWVELSWIALDPVMEVRERFCTAVFKSFVKRGRELFRYGSFFVLTSSLESKSQSESYRYMKQLLNFLNKQFEKRQSVSSSEDKGFSQFAPECMVCTVVYLLAHHPEMPTRSSSEVQAFVSKVSGQRIVVKPLVQLFDTLSTLKKDQSANAGLLYTLLDKMRRRKDALDPACQNIHIVGEMCQMLVKSRMKVSPESLEYPGSVMLPRMYISVEPLGAAVGSSTGVNSLSPGLSPVPTRRGSSGSTIRTPAWKPSVVESVLPEGFELRVGAHSTPKTTRVRTLSANSATSSAKKKKKRRKSENEENDGGASNKATPTRRQPSRKNKNKASYTEKEEEEEMTD